MHVDTDPDVHSGHDEFIRVCSPQGVLGTAKRNASALE